MSWIEELRTDTRPWPKRMYSPKRTPGAFTDGITVPALLKISPEELKAQRDAISYVKEQLDKSGGKFTREDEQKYEAMLYDSGIPVTHKVRLKDREGRTIHRMVSSASPEFLNDYLGLPQKKTPWSQLSPAEKVSRFGNAMTMFEVPVLGNIHPWDLIPMTRAYKAATTAYKVAKPLFKFVGPAASLASKYLNKMPGAGKVAGKAVQAYENLLAKAPVSTKVATALARQAGIMGGWTAADQMTDGAATPVLSALMYATPGQGKIGSTLSRLFAQNSALDYLGSPYDPRLMFTDSRLVTDNFTDDPVAAIRAAAGMPQAYPRYNDAIRVAIAENPDAVNTIVDMIKSEYPSTNLSNNFLDSLKEKKNGK